MPSAPHGRKPVKMVYTLTHGSDVVALLKFVNHDWTSCCLHTPTSHIQQFQINTSYMSEPHKNLIFHHMYWVLKEAVSNMQSDELEIWRKA